MAPRACDRQVFNEVKKLVESVASFAIGLAAKLKDAIESLPTPQDLVNTAREKVEEWFNDKLCLVPSSGSGNQMVVIGPAIKNPALGDSGDHVFVGASRLHI